jgi:hypothetical protein
MNPGLSEKFKKLVRTASLMLDLTANKNDMYGRTRLHGGTGFFLALWRGKIHNSIISEPVPKLIDCALTRTVLEQALGKTGQKSRFFP